MNTAPRTMAIVSDAPVYRMHLSIQGDPLATRITVRILSVSGLTVAEQKEAFFQQNGDDGDSGSLLEQKDGIEIEINNPLQPVLFRIPCAITSLCNDVRPQIYTTVNIAIHQ